MATQTEKTYFGDWMEWMAERMYNLESVTVAQDADADAGLVSGELLETSGGKKVVVATGASCDSILVEPVALADLIAGDVERLALVRGPAVINSAQVTVDSAQKTAALAALLALDIVAQANPTMTTQTT
jgi:hypothetical protein